MGACFCIGRDCPKYDQCFPRRDTASIGGPIGIYIPPTIPTSGAASIRMISTGATTVSKPIEKPTPERVEVDLCVTCKFFKEPDGEPVFPVAKRIGECRRNPPTGDRQWPKVGGADECGEWKRRR